MKALASLKRLALGALATAFALGSSPALAEVKTHVSPYIELQQVFSANIDDGDVLTYTNVAAGVDAGLSTRRVQAQISYRYDRYISWENDSPDGDTHTGIAQLNADIIPNLLKANAGALATRSRGRRRRAVPRLQRCRFRECRRHLQRLCRPRSVDPRGRGSTSARATASAT
jgi:hypothetical protein